MSLMKKGAAITLYHKHELNKTLKVQVEESTTVGSPALVSPTDGQWSAPCDLTGHDASVNKNKKSNKKPVRIRFHPDAFQRANKEPHFAEVMNSSGKKLLADMLGSAWSFQPPTKPDPRLTHIRNLRQLLLETPLMSQSPGTVALTWPIKDKSLTCDTIRSAVQSSIITDSNSAQLRFVGRDKLDELLAIVEVDDTLEGSDCEVRPDCLQWLLRKKEERKSENADLKTLNLDPFHAVHTIRLGPSKDRLRTMELAEARVLALRRSLDDSLKTYQEEQNAARRQNGGVSRRPLTIIFRSKNGALLDISNAEPPPGPLHVTIDESMVGDSLSSSPADSVDSGVSASSESSATGKLTTAALASRMRQRSMSECYSYGHAPPLKGILKRRPKMCRSVSESQQEEDESGVVDEMPRRRRTVEEEDDDADILENLAASETSLDTDGNERPKKRVSFNERVQERCFRPNSSILGQRKKNQKKHRKRQNSGDSTTTMSSDDDGSASYHSLAAQPPLPPAIKPRFFVGTVDLDDEDGFQPGEVAELLMAASDADPAPLDMDNTIQDMDETIQEEGSIQDDNNNDNKEEPDFSSSQVGQQKQRRSTKEARKDSGLDFETSDDLPQVGDDDDEDDNIDQSDQCDSPDDRWLSKKRVRAGKTHQDRKCSGDSGMSDDEVFALVAEE